MTPGLDLDTYTFKLVILGHYSVGKSSIVLNFIKNEFNPNEESTIGAAFLTKTVFIDGTAVKFEIWDTAGQERYYSLIPMYYRGANAALVVYDITSAESFERAKRWIEDLKTEKPDNFMKVLIGNKVDLSEAAVITEEMGKQYAEQEGLLFYQTSAKTGEGIKDLFLELATILPKDQAKSNQMNDLLKKKQTNFFCC
ncbi:GTPase SAR1 related small G protein [Enterocytozoon bieneusi H348]|nr:GTPase SAR1 related small G protein [Enterocytozoon bieneusi H348]|eukprot:XP_002652244.1 GTPase SAR1 related small G protein [Enterocytozoon bieneusi H348]